MFFKSKSKQKYEPDAVPTTVEEAIPLLGVCEDGICLVTAGVDVHKLEKNDTVECSRGYRAKPFHIPYRALLPLGVSNLILAGRCLSGDFYPHAAYRMMGNMAATGEAAGFAASLCLKHEITPIEVNGKDIRSYMEKRGYEL